MPISTKVWKALGAGLAVTILVVAVAWTWVVPALIVGAIQDQFEGKVTIRDWWLNPRSGGVVGLTLHEKPTADSAVVASVQRVTTDLSIGRLLRGRFIPGRIALERPEVTFRVD